MGQWFLERTDSLTYLLSPQANYADRVTTACRWSLPTSADRGCHVVSVTDSYGHILGFLDRICCVNPIDNTYYAPITRTPSTHTKYFTRTLAQSILLEHSKKTLHLDIHIMYFTGWQNDSSRRRCVSSINRFFLLFYSESRPQIQTPLNWSSP
jgi:hypothetical protein